jgi:peptidoglycan hydrolase-like protein with peptidoglycan-binding domain
MVPISLITTVLGLLPDILSAIEKIKPIISQGLSINTIGQLFGDSNLKDLLSKLGSVAFPDLRSDLQTSAGATVLAPDYVKKVQNNLNVLVKPTPPLDVDGHYGALTQSAAKTYQTSHGLVVDGWVGDATMAKMSEEIAKMSDGQKAAATKDVVVVSVPAPVK